MRSPVEARQELYKAGKCRRHRSFSPHRAHAIGSRLRDARSAAPHETATRKASNSLFPLPTLNMPTSSHHMMLNCCAPQLQPAVLPPIPARIAMSNEECQSTRSRLYLPHNTRIELQRSRVHHPPRDEPTRRRRNCVVSEQHYGQLLRTYRLHEMCDGQGDL